MTRKGKPSVKKLKSEEPSRGRPRLKNPRKGGHIPLNDEERARLYAKAASMGLPWSVWARATLLAVAALPDDQQPIRFKREGATES